jgi:hypothetical protein
MTIRLRPLVGRCGWKGRERRAADAAGASRSVDCVVARTPVRRQTRSVVAWPSGRERQRGPRRARREHLGANAFAPRRTRRVLLNASGSEPGRAAAAGLGHRTGLQQDRHRERGHARGAHRGVAVVDDERRPGASRWRVAMRPGLERATTRGRRVVGDPSRPGRLRLGRFDRGSRQGALRSRCDAGCIALGSSASSGRLLPSRPGALATRPGTVHFAPRSARTRVGRASLAKHKTWHAAGIAMISSDRALYADARSA